MGDDDDLYAPTYLSYMWSQLLSAWHKQPDDPPRTLSPAAVKLRDWHLLDFNSLDFHHLDVESDESVSRQERRGWLYGWGFSYVFSRSAWELRPFPDVEFAEDMGFMEGLLAQHVKVSLVSCPEGATNGIVAHTLHSDSTTGQEFKGCGRTCCDAIGFIASPFGHEVRAAPSESSFRFGE